MGCKLVIFGAGNFLSDVFDAALALGMVPAKVILNLPPDPTAEGISTAERIRRLEALGVHVQLQRIAEFEPGRDERYALGISGPGKQVLLEEIDARFGVPFCNLIHPTAYVSALATLGSGLFVGARSVVAAGARLADHVVINRASSVGHDTEIGPFSRLQPGATVCGLVRIGRGVTVGAGATVIERMQIGEGATVSAGAVVVRDVAARTLVMGVPARFVKDLA